MKRKAIQLANKTIVISLPAKWVKQHNIKKGDEIDVFNSENNLVVSAGFKSELKKIKIDINGIEQDTIKKTLAAIVKAGYEEIEIDFNSFEEVLMIQKFLRNNFSNLNVLKQTNKTILIKTLYENNPREIENAIRRFFLLSINLTEETANALKKNDIETLFRASLIRFDIHQLSNYIKKSINIGYEIKYKSAPLYTIINNWTNIAGTYLKLGRYIINNKMKVKKEIAYFIDKLIEIQNNYYNQFYKFDVKEVQKADMGYKNIEKELSKLYKNASPKEIRIISFYDNIINQFQELTRTLITLHI